MPLTSTIVTSFELLDFLDFYQHRKLFKNKYVRQVLQKAQSISYFVLEVIEGVVCDIDDITVNM